MSKELWFDVDRDIPEIGASVGDLVMVDEDVVEVWVCKRHGPDVFTLLPEHRDSLCLCVSQSHEPISRGLLRLIS